MKIGSIAPEFDLLKEYKGQKVVIYFYPKDGTPGCTSQACNLRDNISMLTKSGINIIGISQDSSSSHEKFKEKYSLPFPLVADIDGSIAKKYGVLNKIPLLNKLIKTKRVTFLINEDGTIYDIITKIDVKNHTAQILESWKI